MKIVLTKEEKIIYIAVSISLLFHIIAFVSTLAFKVPLKKVQEEPIYVELRDLPVSSSEVSSPPDKGKSPSVYSDRNRRVKEETRKSKIIADRKRFTSSKSSDASQKGKSLQIAKKGSQGEKGGESASKSGKNDFSYKSQSGQFNKQKGNFKDGGAASSKKASDFIPSGKMLAKRFGSTDGTISLKENKLAAKDELNTQEFLYFSYYKRIHDRLEREWRPADALERKYGHRFNFSGEQQATVVLMILNSDGSLNTIQMVKSSDYIELDKEAIRAIERTQPYESPPKGIINKDGKIQIKWGFILYKGKQQLFRIM